MSEPAIGIEIGGCRVDELIGRGGMGVVYRGTDLQLDRPVAIKLIATEHATDPAVRRRFEREARLMAAIDHPNVIPVYAAGEQDGNLYLVMRYIAGTDLHVLLKERGRLDAREAARIVNDLGGALDAAHAAGLVHRDIKPANVLLAGQHVYLTDFGITRAIDSATRFTDSDEWVGTVDYMSPEHLRGGETDARSDVYALGCLLYACLTGTAPFHRQSAAATILAHIEDSPPRPSDTPGVPRAFDAVIVRALAKKPVDRYATAGELGAAAVEAARGGDGARPPRVVRGRPELAPTAVMPGTEREATGVTARLSFHADRRRARVMLGVLAVLVAIAVAGALAAVLSSSKKTATGPLSSAEVMGAVRAFASAYSDRDPRALARALAPDVERVSPTAVEHGRAAVLAEYEQQFGSEPIRAYELADARVLAGPVGRVSGSYTVLLRGRASITGTVAFGVERVGGRAEIGLIATQ
ncbi:MAG TPA: protein kinase [Solirubrobacteraceae bacterium]|nr:protein kinase [Solirubrobacteraceae bacterium]